jgi:hypothetical protein
MEKHWEWKSLSGQMILMVQMWAEVYSLANGWMAMLMGA